jgi:signal transduction histidine kinase
MSYTRYIIFFIAFLSVCSFKSRAQAVSDSIIVSNQKAPQTYVGNKVDVLEDSAGKLDINNVVKSGLFKHSEKSIPNLGVTKSTFWIRLRIHNSSENKKILLEVENPLLEEVTLYTPTDTSGHYEKAQISKDLPFSARQNQSQNYDFPIVQDSGLSSTYFLKIRSNTQMLVPIKTGTPLIIANDGSNKDLLSGLYFGIMLVMFLYNLFVFISVKDRSYLYYILYIIAVTLVQLNITGFGFKYLWPDFPVFEKFSIYLFPSLTAFTSIAFVRQFLHTKQFVPRLHKGFWIFIAAYLFTIGNAIWGNKLLSYNLLNANALPLSLYMIGIATYIRIKHKYRPAVFFLVAWTVFLLSIMIFVLKDFGVFPYNLLTVSFIQIGSAVEVVLLSIALADRINILTREKEESQAEALRIAEENARIISEQNVVLEAKVEERTIELKASNDGLNKALVELKEAESQLVESEKMASLGQLTAGIAHEINNPINFVTSNVKPLKRDVEILLEVVDTIEKVTFSDVPASEKQKQIDSFKMDIDYDYLKTEIDHLLNGISEGASRTAEIVKGLRIFSRLDEDDLKRADINEGIDSTLVIVNNLLNNRIEVVKNYGAIPLVECYPGKLNQVFLNMITNAIYAINKRFNEQKGGRLTISTGGDEDNVTIKIADNGTGMDDNTKKKLFEPFFTTKDVGEGTGLGLSIAYNTINKHNGRINVNSVLGEGTEFIIEIPKKPPHK